MKKYHFLVLYNTHYKNISIKQLTNIKLLVQSKIDKKIFRSQLINILYHYERKWHFYSYYKSGLDIKF